VRFYVNIIARIIHWNQSLEAAPFPLLLIFWIEPFLYFIILSSLRVCSLFLIEVHFYFSIFFFKKKITRSSLSVLYLRKSKSSFDFFLYRFFFQFSCIFFNSFSTTRIRNWMQLIYLFLNHLFVWKYSRMNKFMWLE